MSTPETQVSNKTKKGKAKKSKKKKRNRPKHLQIPPTAPNVAVIENTTTVSQSPGHSQTTILNQLASTSAHPQKKEEKLSDSVTETPDFSKTLEQRNEDIQVTASSREKVSRQSLRYDKWQKEMNEVITKTTLSLGAALGKGDCFFDAFAQALEEKAITIPGDEKLAPYKRLRRLCKDYLVAIDRKPASENWVKLEIPKRGGEDYQTTLAQVGYTQDELEAFKKEQIFNGLSTWGRPAIEGRIVCEVLSKQPGRQLSLHVMDLVVIDDHLVPVHWLVNATSQKAIQASEVDYSNENIIHIANYHSHYVPLLHNATSRHQIQFNEHSLTEQKTIDNSLVNNGNAGYDLHPEEVQQRDTKAEVEEEKQEFTPIGLADTHSLIVAIRNYYHQAEFARIQRLIYEETFSIEDCFINLTVVEQPAQAKAEMQAINVQELFREEWLHSFEELYQPKKIIPIDKIFSSHHQHQQVFKHLLIEGRAGIGKSTFCRYVAYQWARRAFDKLGQWAESFSLIILLPLRNLQRQPVPQDIYDFIYHEYKLAEAGFSYHDIKQQLSQLEQTNRLLYVLDGFDEVANLYDEDNIQGRILKALFKKDNWIMTSRPYYMSNKLISDYQRLEIMGFTQDNIQVYIKQFFASFNESEKTALFLKCLQDNNNLRSAAHIPIQLELMCSVWKEKGFASLDKNSTLTSLYYQIVKFLLKRYLEQRHRIGTDNLTDKDIFEHVHCESLLLALEEIAWAALQQKNLLLAPALYQPILKKYRSPNSEQWGTFYSNIFKEIGFLKQVGTPKRSLIEQECYFIHLTFQEFFAARYLTRCFSTQRIPESFPSLATVIATKKYEPKYEIVWWFVAGLLSYEKHDKLTTFLNDFFDKLSSQKSFYISLQAIRLLEESGLPKTPVKAIFYGSLLPELITAFPHGDPPARQRLVTYYNMSPNLCAEGKIDELIHKTLTVSTHFVSTLDLWSNYSGLNTPLKTALFQFWQRPDSEQNIILQVLVKQAQWQPQLANLIPRDFLKQCLSKPSLRQQVLLLIGQLPSVEKILIDKIIQCLEEDDNQIKVAAISALGHLNKLNKLDDRIKKEVASQFINILYQESGWVRHEAAKGLRQIAGSLSSLDWHIKKLLLEQMTTGPIRLSSEEKTIEFSGQVNFKIERNNSERIANTLGALITAFSSTSPHEYLLPYLALPKLKSPTGIKAAINITNAFRAARYCHREVQATFLTFLQKAVDAALSSSIAAYFREVGVDSSELRISLHSQLTHQTSLTVKLLLAETLLKNGIRDKTVDNILIAGLQSRDLGDQAIAVLTLHYLLTSEQLIINALIQALSSANFILEGANVTFKGVVLRNLARLGQQAIENILHSEFQKQDENFCWVVQAYERLDCFPENRISLWLDTIQSFDFTDVNKTYVILEMIRILGNFASTQPNIVNAVKQRLTTIERKIWFLFAKILAQAGELDDNSLQQLFTTLLKNENNLSLGRICEDMLDAFSQRHPQQLIPAILIFIKQVQPNNIYLLNVAYRLLSKCDLTNYLQQVIQEKISLPAKAYETTPSISLLKTALNELDEKINLLTVFLPRLNNRHSPLLVSAQRIWWYEPEHKELAIESRQSSLLQRLVESSNANNYFSPVVFMDDTRVSSAASIPVAQVNTQSATLEIKSALLPSEDAKDDFQAEEKHSTITIDFISKRGAALEQARFKGITKQEVEEFLHTRFSNTFSVTHSQTSVGYLKYEIERLLKSKVPRYIFSESAWLQILGQLLGILGYGLDPLTSDKKEGNSLPMRMVTFIQKKIGQLDEELEPFEYEERVSIPVLDVTDPKLDNFNAWEQQQCLIFSLFFYIYSYLDTKKSNTEKQILEPTSQSSPHQSIRVSRHHLLALYLNEIWILANACIFLHTYEELVRDNNRVGIDYLIRTLIAFIKAGTPLETRYCIPCGHPKHAVYLSLIYLEKSNTLRLRVDDSTKGYERPDVFHIRLGDESSEQSEFIRYLTDVCFSRFNEKQPGENTIELIHNKGNVYKITKLSNHEYLPIPAQDGLNCVMEGLRRGQRYRFRQVPYEANDQDNHVDDIYHWVFRRQIAVLLDVRAAASSVEEEGLLDRVLYSASSSSTYSQLTRKLNSPGEEEVKESKVDDSDKPQLKNVAFTDEKLAQGVKALSNYYAQDIEKHKANLNYNIEPWLVNEIPIQQELEICMRSVEQQLTAAPSSQSLIPPPSNAMEYIQSFLEAPEPVLLLLGEAGVGKSLLTWRIVKHLLNPSLPLTWLPLRLELKNLAVENLTGILKKTLLKCLSKQGLNAEEWLNHWRSLSELKRPRILVLLDGFDELREINPVQNKESVVNDLFSHCLNHEFPPNAIKLIVTSRQQAIPNRAYEQETFGFGDEKRYQRREILPFTIGQIENYLGQVISSKEALSEGDEKTELFSLERYRAVLEEQPTVKTLVRNPFVLHLFVEARTRLLHEKITINRFTIYEAFVHQWFEREVKRLPEDILKDLVKQEQKETSKKSLAQRFIQFATLLAHEMFQQNLLKVKFMEEKRENKAFQICDAVMQTIEQLCQKEVKEAQNRPKRGLNRLRPASSVVTIEALSEQRYKQLERFVSACPLRLEHDEEYSFIHKSFYEYFVARYLLDGLASSLEEAINRFSKRLLYEEPAVLDFMVESTDKPLPYYLLLEKKEEASFSPLVKRAWDIVLASRECPDDKEAAANALTWLNYLSPQFQYCNLEGIQVPQVDLCYAFFYRARLNNANLTGARLAQATLRDAELDKTQLAGVYWGEQVYIRRNKTIFNITYHPTQPILALAEGNQFRNQSTFTLYNLETREEQSFPLSAKDICCLSFSSNGKSIAMGSRPGLIQLWDIATGNSRVVGEHPEVNSLAYRPDNQQLASGSEDGIIRLWDVATSQSHFLLRYTGGGGIRSLAYRQDSQQLASGNWNGTIRLWEVATGQSRLLSGHTNWVTCLAYRPDSQQLASGSIDGTLRLWEVATGQSRLLPKHIRRVSFLAYRPDSQQLALGSQNGTLYLWDVATGQSHLLSGHTDRISCLAYRPDNQQLASGSWDGTIRLWEVGSGQSRLLSGHTDRISCLAYRPDDQQLASGSYDGTLRLWEVGSGKSRVWPGHTDKISCLAYRPDNQQLASGSWDGTIRLWEVGSGKSRVWPGHTDRISCLAYRPDNQQLASAQVGSESGYGTLRLWEVGSGQSRLLSGHRGVVNCLAYRPDNQQLASGSSGGILYLWDLATDQSRLLSGHRGVVSCLAYRPDNQQLASGSFDGTLYLWDLATDQSRLLSGHTDTEEEVTCLAYRPDNQQLASGSHDGILYLWDLATDQSRLLSGHTEEVTCLAYCPNSQQLASGSEDGTLRLWNTITGECLQVLSCFGSVTCLAVNALHQLSAGTEKGTVLCWDWTPGQEATLRWISFTQSHLDTTGANWKNALGLTPLDEKLLEQREKSAIDLDPSTPSDSKESSRDEKQPDPSAILSVTSPRLAHLVEKQNSPIFSPLAAQPSTPLSSSALTAISPVTLSLPELKTDDDEAAQLEAALRLSLMPLSPTNQPKRL